jgi:hypothetical protein
MDIMKNKYQNPFLNHPETNEKLQKQLLDQEPLTAANPIVNFIEETKQPLVSQTIRHVRVGNANLITTGQPWMPTGS